MDTPNRRCMAMQVPAHITGWMSNSLATSSLLKAVGVGGGSAEGAAAAAAAIKWITKDGIGAAGRVLVRHCGSPRPAAFGTANSLWPAPPGLGLRHL